MSAFPSSSSPPQPSASEGHTPPRPVASGGVLVDAFGRMRRRLGHLAQGILGNRMEAEDAVQDAFCRMWTHRGDISDDGAAAAILTTSDIEDSPEALACTEMPDLERQELHAQAERRWQEVSRLIADVLTAEQQTVLVRRDYEGADFETIAAELHSTPTAVRMHLSRARRKILQHYQALHATGTADAPPASLSNPSKSRKP